MSAEFNKAAKFYLVYWGDTLVAMQSTMAIPNGGYKDAFRAHRLVVLPDFQGLGIGTKINDFFGEYYINRGQKYFMRTTHVRLKRHMADNKLWRATSSSEKLQAKANVNNQSATKIHYTYDDKRAAASYEYVGADYDTKPHKTLVVDDVDDCPAKDELLALKQCYYLTVVTGHPKVENDCEKLCKELGIRTELLYVNRNGAPQKKEKFARAKASKAPAKKRDAKPVAAESPVIQEHREPVRPIVALRKTAAQSIPREERRRLMIDLETFSNVDISKAGAFKYVESEDFEILLLAYAWDDGPVQVLDLTDPFPHDELPDVVSGLLDPDTIKVAHNSAFERACLSKYLGQDLPPEEWEDTMVLAAMNGLPMSLDAAGAALQLQDQKIKEGTSLISYFCKPCKPTIANGGRTRNLPRHAPEKWERFVEYCRRDVEVEQAIYYRLHRFPVPDWERSVWALDARINERGVMIDTELAEAAIDVDNEFTEAHAAELQRLTGLDNPNSVSQLKDWLATVGVEADSLNKQTVKELKAQAVDPTTRRVLELRQQLGKTSTTKYKTMTAAACEDHRVRGLLQYYGAGRTGRWAGRLVQVQNLPQNHLDQIGEVRELVRQRDLDTLELCYDSVPDVLSQLIRTAFIAKPGHTFLVADYSAIEARVIAYLAGEKWRMDVFAGDGKIYEASYAKAFHVPVESVKKGSPERQKGKIMELALGYGGGPNALIAFGADKLGLSADEMQQLVDAWRLASPAIPRMWRDVETAAKRALETPGRTTSVPCGVKYRRDADALRCRLPSGRVLSYWGAWLEDGSIRFEGQNQTTRKWEKMETWGGRLVENIVQAYARDCLATALLRLADAGYDITFHVHDEIIAEAPEGSRWEDMAEIMSQPIEWAPGLLLRADGYETPFYKKD